MSLLITQILVILSLFITGFILVNLIVCPGKDIKFIAVISYPAGVALFGFVGMFILVWGINYNLISIAIMYALLFILIIIMRIKSGAKIDFRLNRKHLIMIIAVVIIAFISTCGIISVGISNDSLYYYSLYPQTIAIDGSIELSYDVFLTDVGQIVAIINTLPFLFGFNEAYGIMLAMMFSFVAFFIYFINERMIEIIAKPRVVVGGGIVRYIAENPIFSIRAGTIMGAIVLITCTPFLVMSRWVLANAYVMEYMFMIFGLAYFAQKENEHSFLWIIALFIANLTMMRMEGGLMAGLLIVCISMYEISNEDLLRFCVFPSLIFIIPYYVVLYIKLGVNPEYSFLDIKNALLQVAFLVAIGLYIMCMRHKDWFKYIDNHFSAAVITALFSVNVILFAYDHNKYTENVMAFFKNIVLGNGWGYFGFFLILMLIVISKNKALSANSLFCISYILMCNAVLFARNGALRVGSGDSGNRVLMQIVPFVIYTLIDETLGEFKNEK